MPNAGKASIQIDINIQKKVIDTQIYTKKRNLVVEFEGLPNSHGVYEGDYSVTPKFIQQTLETNGLLMKDDVVVLDIPVSITENLSGGNTVVIGG